MLSNDERRTLEKIQADLTESDPELARMLASGKATGPSRHRRGLVWAVGLMASLQTLAMLAVGVAIGAFVAATVVGAVLVCQLWWPHRGLTHPRRRNP